MRNRILLAFDGEVEKVARLLPPAVRATVHVPLRNTKEALALDVLKALKGLRPAGRLFARWRVTFEGEQGRDDGGILVATYAKVHRHLYGCTATRHLFEVDPDAERGIADSETCVLPLADAKWAATFAKGVSLEPPPTPPPRRRQRQRQAAVAQAAVAPAARRAGARGWTRRCRWRRRCRCAAGCSPRCCSTATGTASTTASPTLSSSTS